MADKDNKDNKHNKDNKDNVVLIGGNGSEPPQIGAPEDARDYESLWLDPALGDGIVDVHYHKVTVDKPKDFFRTHPYKDYRRRAEIYTHKPEGAIEEVHYILAPSMHGQIPEARTQRGVEQQPPMSC